MKKLHTAPHPGRSALLSISLLFHMKLASRGDEVGFFTTLLDGIRGLMLEGTRSKEEHDMIVMISA